MRKRLGFFIGILFFSVASGQTSQRKEQLQKQNAELNGVLNNLYVGLPDEFYETLKDQKADVFVANILAGPLMMLAPQFATLVKPESEFALAGVIQEQVEEVSSVYSEFFDILQVETRDEYWCRISGKRHSF